MELFVLGAGFSKSFVPKAPLLARFLSDSKKLLNKDEFSAAKRFIDNCRFKASTANMETVMTLADQHDREASEQLKRLMFKVINNSFETTPENGTRYRFNVEHEESLRGFAKYLLKCSPPAHVITLNYDVLLENFLELEQITLEEPKRFHSGRCYGFHADKLKNGKIKPQRETERKRHLFVLKLHGSVNWLVLTDGRYAHRVVISSAHEKKLEKHYQEAAVFVPLPLIVPPVLDKTNEIVHCALAQVWARATNLIQKARRIVFVGYSFPPTDFHAEYLFRVNYSEDCQIEVIDKGGCAGDKRRLSERYKDIFGKGVKFHWGDAAIELKNLIDL